MNRPIWSHWPRAIGSSNCLHQAMINLLGVHVGLHLERQELRHSVLVRVRLLLEELLMLVFKVLVVVVRVAGQVDAVNLLPALPRLLVKDLLDFGTPVEVLS